METFKDITDFPNYEVSNLGNVRNKKTKRILKAICVKKKGDYISYEVCLYNDTRQMGYNKKIHRLVAQAFIPNPDNRIELDHIDRNSANNKVDNLKWCTRSENVLNSRTRCDNQLGEKNICIIFGKYYVIIERDKKQVFYNSYDTLDDAKKARDDFNNGLIENPHKPRASNIGEKNITQRGNSYRVEIVRNKVIFQKQYKTLEEAIKARDDFIQKQSA